jgi:hypothetical protein
MPIIKGNHEVSGYIEMTAKIALGLIDFSDDVEMPENPLGPEMGEAIRALEKANAINQLKTGKMPKDFSDGDFDSFINCLQAWKDCDGCLYWYDWNIKHWGTKWNSYSFRQISDTCVVFSTAWNAPAPVIQKLAERAGSSIKHEWADEDMGNNVGIIEFSPQFPLGRIQDLSGTKEGFEEDYVWNGSEYVYVDKEEYV